jgi:hypothetical protein
MDKDEIQDLIAMVLIIMFNIALVFAILYGLYKFYEIIFHFIYKIAAGVYHLLDKLINKI